VQRDIITVYKYVNRSTNCGRKKDFLKLKDIF